MSLAQVGAERNWPQLTEAVGVADAALRAANETAAGGLLARSPVPGATRAELVTEVAAQLRATSPVGVSMAEVMLAASRIVDQQGLTERAQLLAPPPEDTRWRLDEPAPSSAECYL